MGKYSLLGSEQFDRRIEDDLESVVHAIKAMPEANQWLAIVLMGGYGRGEGTPLILDGLEVPYNDYDFIIVAQDMPRWRRNALQKKIHQLEQFLSKKLGIAVDIYLHTLHSLHHAEFSLMNYELKNGHRVLWGPLDILKEMPDYRLSEISLLEGTRLLLNRGTLLLDNQQIISENFQRLKFLKYLLKGYLAFGDCVLLAFRQYEMSYKNKAVVLQKVCDLHRVPNSQWLVDRYKEAVEFKNWGEVQKYRETDLLEMQQDVCRYWIEFFCWYEKRRLQLPDKSLESVEEYCQVLKKDKISYLKPLKSVILNLIWFKKASLKPSSEWLFIYPRFRLFPALWILLKEKRSASEENLLKQLIVFQDRSMAYAVFLSLKERFG